MKAIWQWVQIIGIIAGIFGFVVLVTTGIMKGWAFVFDEGTKAEGCIQPTLYNTLYGGRYEGVRYLYTCADGTMIEVSNPIPGAKVK